jgi:flagellar biosynthetic protein FliP
MRARTIVIAALAAGASTAAWAQQAAGGNLPLLVGQGPGGNSFSVPIQTLLFFTALALWRGAAWMLIGRLKLRTLRG